MCSSTGQRPRAVHRFARLLPHERGSQPRLQALTLTLALTWHTNLEVQITSRHGRPASPMRHCWPTHAASSATSAPCSRALVPEEAEPTFERTGRARKGPGASAAAAEAVLSGGGGGAG